MSDVKLNEIEGETSINATRAMLQDRVANREGLSSTCGYHEDV